jgi:flagellar basal-body rod protein FlgC
MHKISMVLFICIVSGCGISNGPVRIKPKELKIMTYGDAKMAHLINFILYKDYALEMIDEDYLILKNANETTLMELLEMLRLKTDVIADNIANVSTTRPGNGGPYIRKYVEVTVENGVAVIDDTETPLRDVYDPMHPDAITAGALKGYVKMPNIDIVTEMNDMIETSRLYESILEYAKNNYKNTIW